MHRDEPVCSLCLSACLYYVYVSARINTTIKITSVCDGHARSVGGGRGWLPGDG